MKTRDPPKDKRLWHVLTELSFGVLPLYESETRPTLFVWGAMSACYGCIHS